MTLSGALLGWTLVVSSIVESTPVVSLIRNDLSVQHSESKLRLDQTVAIADTDQFIELVFNPDRGVCLFQGSRLSGQESSCLISGFRETVLKNLAFLEYAPEQEAAQSSVDTLVVSAKLLNQFTREVAEEISVGTLRVAVSGEPAIQAKILAVENQTSVAQVWENSAKHEFRYTVHANYPKPVWLDVTVLEINPGDPAMRTRGLLEICENSVCVSASSFTLSAAVNRNADISVFYRAPVAFWGQVHLVGTLWARQASSRAVADKALDETHVRVTVKPIAHAVTLANKCGHLQPWTLLPHCFVVADCISFADNDPLAFFLAELTLPEAVAIRAKETAKVAFRPSPQKLRLWGQRDEVNDALSEIRLDLQRRLFLGTKESVFATSLQVTIYSLGRFPSTDMLPGLVQLKQDSSLALSLSSILPVDTPKTSLSFEFDIYRDNLPPKVEITKSKQTRVFAAPAAPFVIDGVTLRDFDLESALDSTLQVAVVFEAVNGCTLTLSDETSEVIKRTMSLVDLNALLSLGELKLNRPQDFTGRTAVQITVSDLGRFSGCKAFDREDLRILNQCVVIQAQTLTQFLSVTSDPASGGVSVQCDQNGDVLTHSAVVSILIH